MTTTPPPRAPAAAPARFTTPRWSHVPLVATLLGAATVTWLPGPRLAQRLVCLVLILLAIPAFAFAVRAADRTPWRTLLTTGFLAQLAVAPALPFTSKDVFANLAYGRILARGGNPFLVTPLEFFGERMQDPFAQLMHKWWHDTKCVYGPVVAGIDWLVVAWSPTPQHGMFALKALATLTGVLCVWLAYQCARGFDNRTGFTLLALNPLFAWELSGQAHNDVFLIPFLLGFVWALRRGHTAAAALAAGGSLLVKPMLLPMLGLWLVVLARQRRFRSALAVLGLVAAVLVAGWAPFWSGPETLRIVLKSVVGDHMLTTNSLAEALRDLTLLHSPALNAAALAAWRVVTLTALALVGLRALARVRDPDDVVDEGFFFLLFLLGIVAWFQPWYVTWTLPFAVATRNRTLALIAGFYGTSFLLGYLTGQYVISWIAHATMLALIVRDARATSASTRRSSRSPAPSP